ncbi:MAG: hypothetical protein U1E59_17890 [Amaricoccus sp.]
MTDVAAPGPGPRFLGGLLRFLLASTELWLGCVWLAGRAAPTTLLAAHAAVAGTILALAWACRRRETGLWLDAAMILFTGPLGALSMLWQRGSRTPADAAASLRDALASRARSRAEALHADLLAGRRRRGDPGNRQSMMDRVTRGGLAEQQFAIAMLSLKYQPELHPVLLAALQSPAPAVRVQAAAVFAKLRERFGAESKRLLAADIGAAADQRQQRERAAACRRLAASPFADGGVAAALLDRARSLEADPAEAAAAPVAPAAEYCEAADRAGQRLVAGTSPQGGLRIKAAG